MDNEIIITPEQAAAELLRRRRAKDSLIAFTEYTYPKYTADPFHHMVAEKLEAVERGEIKRLMIFAPPRHGKSELSTRRFPAWFMARNPDKNIISASYNADFAKGFGRNVRDIIETKEFSRIFPDVRVRSDNRASDEWELEQGGKYFAVGVSTSTTGRGAHLFLIDDPLKDRKDADSAITREDQWNWYRDVVYTRLEEDAPIILTLTRWHHDDIAGRLLKLMEEGRGLPWDILTLPALPIVRKTQDGKPILLDDGTVPGDALRRKPNEPLAPNRFSFAALQDRQEVLGDRSWSALYQQQPQSEEGGMFRSNWLKVIEPSELPPKRARVRAWDLAASTDGDFTVGVLMSRDTQGIYYIENVIRMRGTPHDVRSRILKTAKDDGKSVKIVVPQDPGQAGKDQAQSYIRALSGYRVKAKRPSGPKQTRAEPLASQAEGGNVRVVRGHWNQVFFDELDTFPLGSNDDQVDAAADAFNELQGPRKPAVFNW